VAEGLKKAAKEAGVIVVEDSDVVSPELPTLEDIVRAFGEEHSECVNFFPLVSLCGHGEG
jgi:hypothetical protein